MSERAKREDTLDRMRTAHPQEENEQLLTDLAVRADRKAETVSGIKWLVAGAVILALGYGLTKMFSVWLLLAAAVIAANGVRLMLCGPRIAQRYREEPLPEEGGLLTRERITLDCRKGLQASQGGFYIVKAPLHDMGVDYDTGLFQLFSQKFFFRAPEGVYSLSVKRKQYRTAALDAQYYVIFSQGEKFRDQIPVGAYQADSWTLSEDLTESVADFPEVPRTPEEASAKLEGRKKILPGISIALSLAAMWVPGSVMPLLCLGGLALAVIAVIRDKNSWTSAAVMISVMSLVITLMLFVPALLGK